MPVLKICYYQLVAINQLARVLVARENDYLQVRRAFEVDGKRCQ